VQALFGADGGGRRGEPGRALELSFGNPCGFMKKLDQWRRAHSEFDGNAPQMYRQTVLFLGLDIRILWKTKEPAGRELVGRS
jgi:hypothetical protein